MTNRFQSLLSISTCATFTRASAAIGRKLLQAGGAANNFLGIAAFAAIGTFGALAVGGLGLTAALSPEIRVRPVGYNL